MASLDSIVSVTIDAQTTNPTQTGFGTPLLVGFHTRFSERVRFYEQLADMLSDGFTTSDALYKMARACLAQNPRPSQVAIGRLTTASTMIVNLVPVVRNSHEYTVEINGTEFSFTSDSGAADTEIVAGLIAAINAGSEPVTASGTTTLTLTADVAGTVFELVADYADFSIQNVTTDGSGIAAQLAAISVENDTWYGVAMDSCGKAEIEACAAYLETVKKIGVFATGDSDVLGASTTDVASSLQDDSLDRCPLIFSRSPHDYPNAAALGRMLPETPGAATWKFKTLAGVTVDTFTATERTNMRAKSCNFYETIAGVSILQEGVSPSGEFVDVTILVDWLAARIQEAVYGVAVNLKKIPFTDIGIALVENAIRGVLQLAVSNGGLVEDTLQVIVPRASAINPSDKAARRLTGVSFQGVLAGAIHSAVLRGTVTV